MSATLDKLLIGIKANRERMVSRSQRLAHDQARATARQHFGSDYQAADAGEDMINIDSPTTYNITGEKTQRKPVGTLMRFIASAALIGSGMGIGVVAPIAFPLIQKLFNRTEATEGPETIDTRNVYQLKLGDPD